MIIIDAGHGGSDYGGGSNSLFSEKDMALKISLYQYNRFKELGIPVSITRTSDISLPPNARINKIKSLGKADILISNHINSSSSNFSGVEVIHSINDSQEFSNIIAQELKKEGLNINRIFTRRNSRGNDYYYIIRNTRPTQSVIVEYGFGNNEDDAKKILNNYEIYAEAVVRAVCLYLGYPYTSDSFYQYTVKKNDSLYKIANKTGVSVDEIKSFNNLNTNLIKPDQILKIPYRQIQELAYYPLKNEIIRNIANKYNTSIKAIQMRNKIESDIINDEEEIIIPLSVPLIPYRIQKGDTLFKIAYDRNITLYQLVNFNNIKTNNLRVGDIILVPPH